MGCSVHVHVLHSCIRQMNVQAPVIAWCAVYVRDVCRRWYGHLLYVHGLCDVFAQSTCSLYTCTCMTACTCIYQHPAWVTYINIHTYTLIWGWRTISHISQDLTLWVYTLAQHTEWVEEWCVHVSVYIWVWPQWKQHHLMNIADTVTPSPLA